MVIYQETNVKVYRKMWHIHKAGKRVHRGFTYDYGDIPVALFNDITRKFEPVVNNRGCAYAHRNGYQKNIKNNC